MIYIQTSNDQKLNDHWLYVNLGSPLTGDNNLSYVY